MARSTTREQPAPATSYNPDITVPRVVPLRRRSPAKMTAAIALVAAGGVGGAALYMSTGHRVSVLAVAKPVAAGQVITADDLSIADISTDPMLSPITAGSKQNIIGKRAAVALVPGTLLVPGDLSNSPLTTADSQTVGLSLKPGQMPGQKLAPGQKVVIVFTPDQGSASSTTTAAPTTIEATITRVGSADPQGNIVVDVAVPSAQAASLAAQAANGHIALTVSDGGAS